MSGPGGACLREDLDPRIHKPGVVDGKSVADIVLDTGSARTMVRKELVAPGKEITGSVSIKCAQGNIVTYRWRST